MANMRMIERVLIIVMAYVLASLVSGVLIGLGLFFLGGPSGGRSLSQFQEFAPAIGVISLLVGVLCALPSVFAILLSELESIRGKIYYVLYAMAVGWLLDILASLVAGRGIIFFGIASTLCGPAAGYVYWIVAGRNAGNACRPHYRLISRKPA